MRRPFTYSLIAVFAAAGATLSGYLSYVNLWGSGCEKVAISCSASATGPVMIFGLPNCVYGFAMFFAVFILSLFLIAWENRKIQTVTFVLPFIGMLFAAGLTMYETFWLKVTSVPACAYGLTFYTFIVAIIRLQQQQAKKNANQSPANT